MFCLIFFSTLLFSTLQFFHFSVLNSFCQNTRFSHLCVAASSKSLAAPLAAQTGAMPVLAQWCHLLGYGGKHTQMYTTLVTHCSNHFADSHLLAQTRFLIPRFLEAWNYLPKYTFLLHRGHRLASPEKVVMLPAVDTLQTHYNSGKAKGERLNKWPPVFPGVKFSQLITWGNKNKNGPSAKQLLHTSREQYWVKTLMLLI